jgi:hypothetical protein
METAMKVFWVLAFDAYYPSSDNFEASFETREEAEAFIEKEKVKEYPDFVYEYYKIIDISDRL